MQVYNNDYDKSVEFHNLRAREIFKRLTVHNRPDLKKHLGNWQMGEVTAMAAQRLKRYMRSGPHSKRTYKSA